MEIRLLLDHRNDLVAERTRAVNRLRWHLLQLCPALERSLGRGSLNQSRVLDRIDRRLRRLPAGARVRIAREQVAQIRRLTRRTDALKSELAEKVEAHRPQLLAETGCGPLTAAILIGRTACAERFRSDASFALQSGTAPIPCSSGQRHQHRLNRGGDRQLNHALHIIAISRASHDPATKEYRARKEAEGKTAKGGAALPQTRARQALPQSPLSLPAQIPRPDHITTKEIPQQSRERERSKAEGSIVGAAPNPMLCTTCGPASGPAKPEPFAGPLPPPVTPTGDVACRDSTPFTVAGGRTAASNAF